MEDSEDGIECAGNSAQGPLFAVGCGRMRPRASGMSEQSDLLWFNLLPAHAHITRSGRWLLFQKWVLAWAEFH